MSVQDVKPEVKVAGVNITEYYGEVRVYDIEALPVGVQAQIAELDDGVVEPDCS